MWDLGVLHVVEGNISLFIKAINQFFWPNEDPRNINILYPID